MNNRANNRRPAAGKIIKRRWRRLAPPGVSLKQFATLDSSNLGREWLANKKAQRRPGPNRKAVQGKHSSVHGSMAGRRGSPGVTVWAGYAS